MTPLRPSHSEPTGEAPQLDAYQPSQPTRSGSVAKWIGKSLALALAATLALSGPAALAADLPSRVEMMTATGQMHPEIQPGGANFDLSPNQLRQQIANSVTQDQLQAGQPAYQAAESQQSSKRYYRPELEQEIQQAQAAGTLTPARLAELMQRYEYKDGGPNINQGTSFRYCVSMSPSSLKCNAALNNQISYKLLSCQYKNAEGKLETVIHRSYQHQYTNNMQRGVCGGHRLESKMVDGFSQWGPVQVSPEGAPLYLNPANIIATLPSS